MRYPDLHQDRPRDARQSRAYAAESWLRPMYVGRKYAPHQLGAMQEFVDSVVHDPWFRRNYRVFGRRRWSQVDRAWRNRTRGEDPGDTPLLEVVAEERRDPILRLDYPVEIVVPSRDTSRRDIKYDWAWCDLVMLHEIAHWVTPTDEPFHGAWFAGCLASLIEHYIHPLAGHTYRNACIVEGVTAPLRRAG